MLLSLLLLSACGTAPTATPVAVPSAPPSPGIINYRGDAQRSGVYEQAAIREMPQVQWQSKISSMWLMPPLVAEDAIYAGSGDGSLYAIDLATGKQTWSAAGFEALESTGAISGDRIIATGFSKKAMALDRHTGEVLWSLSLDHWAQGAPLIVGEKVYIATDHELYALDLQSGEILWRTATGDEDAYMGGPAYQAGVVYTTGGRQLLAVNAESGEVLWQVEAEKPLGALGVRNGMIYVGELGGIFRAFDQASGEARWQFERQALFWSAPAVSKDTVYAGSTDGLLYALDAMTGAMRWSYRTGGSAVSEPVLVEGALYVADGSHEEPMATRHLAALDPLSGEELWVFETQSTFLPAPGVGPDGIYVNARGEMIALR